MDDIFARIVENLAHRISGPMHARLILQPLMALLSAVRAGLRDAKTGRPGEALLVAMTLAFIPYLVFRGVVTRLARRGSASVRDHRML